MLAFHGPAHTSLPSLAFLSLLFIPEYLRLLPLKNTVSTILSTQLFSTLFSHTLTSPYHWPTLPSLFVKALPLGSLSSRTIHDLPLVRYISHRCGAGTR